MKHGRQNLIQYYTNFVSHSKPAEKPSFKAMQRDTCTSLSVKETLSI